MENTERLHHRRIFQCLSLPLTNLIPNKHHPLFFVDIRNGDYVQVHNIGAKLVQKYLCHISQRFVRYGQPKPGKSWNQRELNLSISNLIKYYRNTYLLPQYNMVTPITTVRSLTRFLHFSTHHVLVTDMVAISFLFLLPVG